MEFDVYCDESYPDLLISKHSTKTYLVIGSLWLPTDLREKVKEDIHNLRNRHKIGGEFKWHKISPSKKDFYSDLITYFFHMDTALRFRAILVNKHDVNLPLYQNGDQELGFYKFYYQVLHHWILDFNEYNLFLDYKKNRESDRLHVLHECLRKSNLSSSMPIAQSVRSDESLLIQFADFFTGMVAAKFNSSIVSSQAKKDLIDQMEKNLKHQLVPTGVSEKKFNLFMINLRGGW